jgi:hypothetical protein
MLKIIFKIGDKVRYSVAFLQSIGMYKGKIITSKGIITNIQQYGSRVSGTTIATIKWEDSDFPTKINTAKKG